MMNFYTSSEYTFAEIYHFWNGDKEIIQDKSAEHLTINLCEPDRLNTLTMRGIDGTWTGAVDISWDGVLTVDDLVRDRTHALSPTRMEGTWNEYLNKMHDRLNPFLATDGKDPREYDLQGLDIFPEPPESRIMFIDYLSALIGFSRKSLYASLMPSSSSVLYVQPSFVALDTSRSFLGVPLGFVVSHSIFPS